MQQPLTHARRPALLLALVALSVAPLAAAMTADEFFLDGNRLFRDDLYWAALLRYRQAGDEGMDTPLLHFNTGVTHYRAQQHARANASLLRALDDPALRVAAQYNLGLNAHAAGRIDDALRWLRQARDQTSEPQLSRYAAIAIERIQNAAAMEETIEPAREPAPQKRPVADLEISAMVGFGQDDNVFRAPEEPYDDLSEPSQPLITPVMETGVFIPVRLNVKYRINSLPFEGFYVRYRGAGRYYQERDFENGDEYQHEVSIGSEYRREQDDRVREVFSAFRVAQHEETWYDPDDGSERTVEDIPAGTRLDYLRYGPELRLRQSHRNWSFGLGIKAQLWNYQELEDVVEYDHEFFDVNLFTQYSTESGSLLRITANAYSRRFGDRRAYDLDGQQRTNNPDMRYDYYALQMTGRQRVLDNFWFGFDLGRTHRLDKYERYNNYYRNEIGVEMHWDPGRRFDLKLAGRYYNYDFPDAFAFHLPAAGLKTQESARIELAGRYRMTQRLFLVAEARYDETVSTDQRIQYERHQVFVGVEWRN